jgi:predicted dehydrogenase
MKVGIVGCGDISGIYLKNITNMFKEIEIAGVCDLIQERADRVEKEWGVRKYKDMHELFADPQVDIVLNITRPYEHFEVSMAAIAAGKHVYIEKPLGATFEEGVKTLEAAKAKGVRVGGAPDTFLGAGCQTCRKLIDDGYIGVPVAATAFLTHRGHETWHPDPEYFYQYGGGPMLDMGPYYVTQLVNLLGRVKRLVGMTKQTWPTRTITNQYNFGNVFDVETNTYQAGLLEFESGVMATILTTYDVHRVNGLPRIEIYGSEGNLSVPDPNTFGGPVKLFRTETGEYKDLPLTFGYPENSRALGLADMCKSIATGRPPRTGSDLTYHVLEIMTGIDESAKDGAYRVMKTPFERSAPMVNTALIGILD